MFAENQKISARQLKRLLVLDWLGKAGLLLPRFAGGLDGEEFLTALLITVVLTMCYVWLICRVAAVVENSFFGYVWFRLGRVPAAFITTVYWIYMFVNVSYLLRLFAAIAKAYLLLEVPETALILLVAVIGFYAASGGLEVRARFAEILYNFVFFPLIFLLIAAAFSVQESGVSQMERVFSPDAVARGAMMVSAFGGVGIYLYLIPAIRVQKNADCAMRKGVGITLAGECLLFLTFIGTFGERGTRALSWPLLTLMSSVKLPGGFIRRWDVVFSILFLGSFFVAAAAGIFYMGFLAKELFGKWERNIWSGIGTVLAVGCACSLPSYAAAVRLYTVVNGCMLLPLMFFFTILLAVLEWGAKKRKKIRFLFALFLVCLLTGCGRELEDRNITSVLVIEELPIENSFRKAEKSGSQYPDYGQVKAIILPQKDGIDTQVRSVLYYLERMPEISRNSLVFLASEEAVTAINARKETIGDSLEDLYKNVPGREKEDAVTMAELLYFFHNKEEGREIPVLILNHGQVMLKNG